MTLKEYTRVNKRIRLFPKLQGNMGLLPNMRLIMKAKIDHTQNRDTFLVARIHDRRVESQRSPILYRRNSLVMKPLGEKLISWNRHYTEFRLSGVVLVDLVFTVDSPKSVSCDAMTNGPRLDENN